MTKQAEDSAAIRIPPPLYFFICLGTGLGLDYLFPIAEFDLPHLSRFLVGIPLLILSGAFAVAGFAALIRNKTPFDTSKATVKIVTSGIFRYSRNPMYLSLLLFLLGLALLLSSIGLLLTTPLLYFLLLYRAILPEEHYLSEKFGDSYKTYMESVRRWL